MKMEKLLKNFGEDEKTSCQNTGENENDENEILYFLQNLERNLSQKYFISKIFFFLKKIIFKKSSPDFGKPQKFHDFVFSSPEFKQKSFPPEKDSTSPGERSGEFRRIVLN